MGFSIFCIRASKAKGYPIGDFTRSASAKHRKKFVGTNPHPYDKNGGVYMQNRTRNVQIKFWVTPEERKLIEQKMAALY